MRNPLKRLSRRDHPRVPLRERLAAAKGKLTAAKEKYARTLRVHRALNGPLPQPEPAVDRAALVNYATFLALERECVCAELYPWMGHKASRFVLAMNEAWRFFHANDQDAARRRGRSPSSARAEKILDGVGIDWRRDRDSGGVTPDLEHARGDTGERPGPLVGFPSPDAELLDALDLLTRTEAAQNAFLESEADDPDLHPAYLALEAARAEALTRLRKTRAKPLGGLQAKAKAVRVNEHCSGATELTESLIADLLGSTEGVLSKRHDPMHRAIAEADRLSAVVDATFHEWPHDTSEPEDLIARRSAATEALRAHVIGTLLKTTPTMAEGCRALARFALTFWPQQGLSLDDDGPAILGLIAKSPAL